MLVLGSCLVTGTRGQTVDYVTVTVIIGLYLIPYISKFHEIVNFFIDVCVICVLLSKVNLSGLGLGLALALALQRSGLGLGLALHLSDSLWPWPWYLWPC